MGRDAQKGTSYTPVGLMGCCAAAPTQAGGGAQLSTRGEEPSRRACIRDDTGVVRNEGSARGSAGTSLRGGFAIKALQMGDAIFLANMG